MQVIESYDPLYKRGVGGEVRQWSMQLGQDGDVFAHRVVSGITDGKKVESGWSFCEPKNVGRANATTAEEQARAEIAALYVRKKDRGCFEDINEIDNVPFTKPMLATDWEKVKTKVSVSDGVVLQPKLDGIRCIARADGLWTRTGKPIISCDHIFDALRPAFDLYPDLILDGELYNHELREDFNTITSVVRKAKPKPEDVEKAARLIQYHVYDIVDEATAYERQCILGKLGEEFGWADWKDSMVITVDFVYTETFDQIDTWYAEWIKEGYEGQMIRLPNVGYEHKRSKTLLKRKEFLSEEFHVLRTEEGNGNWAGMVKRFIFALPDGRECGAGVRGTQEKLKELFESGNTPDWATVRFFTPTPDGMPRFPVVVDYGWGERSD